MLLIILITQLLDNSAARMSAVGFTYKCASIAIFRFVISRAILLFFQCHRIIKIPDRTFSGNVSAAICGSRRSRPQASLHVTFTDHCETTLLKQKILINAADTVIARRHLDCHMVQYHLYGHMSHWQNINN